MAMTLAPTPTINNAVPESQPLLHNSTVSGHVHSQSGQSEMRVWCFVIRPETISNDIITTLTLFIKI